MTFLFFPQLFALFLTITPPATLPQTTAVPQGQQIGGEEECDFLHAWRAKAQSQVYLAPIGQDVALYSLVSKIEYLDYLDFPALRLQRAAATGRTSDSDR